MSKYFTLALVLLVASCGGGYSPPRNLENACAIIKERPKYFRAMKRAERNWGVPVAVQMATIHQESKFVGNARTPHKYVLGVIPMGREVRAFVDALGRLNQQVAAACERVTLMAAGLPLTLKDRT